MKLASYLLTLQNEIEYEEIVHNETFSLRYLA